MSDPLDDNPFDPFADAVEESLRAMRAEIRSLREELLTRSAPQVIEGPPGKDGKDGADGKDGIDGKDGTPGERGADGLNGKDGAVGERGTDGLNGRDGAPGERGERGADGIASREELESIVEARFADLKVRTLADSWRGVWAPGVYQRGTVVQWDGSPWLSLKDTTEKPGASPHWTLFAKKGRDGKK